MFLVSAEFLAGAVFLAPPAGDLPASARLRIGGIGLATR
jgi:hypothetical protein